MIDPNRIVTKEMVPEIDVQWAVPAIVTRYSLAKAKGGIADPSSLWYGRERVEQLVWMDERERVVAVAWVRRDVLARVLFEE